MVAREPSYCPQCGSQLITVEQEDRERRYCETCDRIVYRNPVPGADVAVVDGDSVLLIERSEPPGVGKWCVPGGHLEFDEPPRDGAARELREETGLQVDPNDLTILGARKLVPIDGKHIISVEYAVRRDETEGSIEAGSDARDTRFVSRRDLADMDFALPHIPAEARAALDALGDE